MRGVGRGEGGGEKERVKREGGTAKVDKRKGTGKGSGDKRKEEREKQ